MNPQRHSINNIILFCKKYYIFLCVSVQIKVSITNIYLKQSVSLKSYISHNSYEVILHTPLVATEKNINK